VITMKLKFIGTTSKDGDCPTLYDIEDSVEYPDHVAVQGDILDDPEALAQLKDVKKSETFVIVPRSLLVRYAPKE
jgi:hypothetical protein